ncbi:hypothetical protein [Maribacter aquivivus]|uniref:hypothetical protein n=1 Tax=Maribacter aquivivus TaxID=228958 RepID=UPI001114883A|nr:hypothetical protein [Maribacter aquivivus]
MIKMGQSHNLISICEVQNDVDFYSYLKDLDSYFSPGLAYSDKNARYPNLTEIYQALKDSGIKIIEERKTQDSTELKNGKDITIHVFGISDDETEFTEDLTIRYESQNINNPVNSISGIKTDIRILIKLSAELTKFCGSIFIMNPYESFFIEKNKTYSEVWNELLEKTTANTTYKQYGLRA